MFRFKVVVERGIKTDFCFSTIVQFDEFLILNALFVQLFEASGFVEYASFKVCSLFQTTKLINDKNRLTFPCDSLS